MLVIRPLKKRNITVSSNGASYPPVASFNLYSFDCSQHHASVSLFTITLVPHEPFVTHWSRVMIAHASLQKILSSISKDTTIMRTPDGDIFNALISIWKKIYIYSTVYVSHWVATNFTLTGNQRTIILKKNKFYS